MFELPFEGGLIDSMTLADYIEFNFTPEQFGAAKSLTRAGGGLPTDLEKAYQWAIEKEEDGVAKIQPSPAEGTEEEKIDYNSEAEEEE